MFAFLIADEYLVFSCALAVSLAFIALELAGTFIGFSFFSDTHADHDFDLSGDSFFASISAGMRWMGFGKVPLLAHLILLAGLFGLIGMVLLHIIYGATGLYLSNWAAVPIALIGTVFLSNRFTALVVKIIPTDETNAISVSELVGYEATISVGKATHTMPAPANTVDKYGTQHNFMVCALDAGTELNERTKVRLVSLTDNGYFYATPLN